MPVKYERAQPIRFAAVAPRGSTVAVFTIASARSDALLTARVVDDDSGGRFAVRALTSYAGAGKVDSTDGTTPLRVGAGQTVKIEIRFASLPPDDALRYAATLLVEARATPPWLPIRAPLYGQVESVDTPWSRTEEARALDGDRMWANWGVSDSTVTVLGYLPTPRLFRPTNVHEVARAVRAAESAHTTIRALGSGWSFSEAALPQTAPVGNAESFIHNQGGYPDDRALTDLAHGWKNAFGWAVDTTTLDRSLQALLPALLREPKDATSLCFVEAGMTLHFLNRLLDAQDPPLALPTLGGASAQTVAGAISTGTHGGDYLMPPVGDAVRAIYLVGAGGVHHWIQPIGSPIDPLRVRAAFPSIRPENVHEDTGLFRAALVSMGAMGIIYAVVLSVVPQFSLLDWNKRTTWEDLKAQAGAGLAGVLDGSWSAIPRPPGSSPNRFVSVAISPLRNPDGKHNCWVTNRVQLPLQAPNGNLAPTGYDFDRLKDKIIAAIRDRLIARASDLVGTTTAAIDLLNAFVKNEFNECEATKNELNLVAFTKRHDRPDILSAAFDVVADAQYPEAADAAHARIDVGYRVLASSDTRRSQPPLGGTSSESAFTPGLAIAFIDALLAEFDRSVADDKVFPAGYVSLRMTGQTSALLGMERYDRNGMIEVAMLGNQDGYALNRKVQELTLQRGGTLHWGQSNGLMKKEHVVAAYGQDAVDQWRAAQRMLGGDTFKNLFMQRCGLADATPDTRPRLQFSASTIRFKEVKQGQEVPSQHLIIRNYGGVVALVTVAGPPARSPFTWDDHLNTAIPPQGRLDILVGFSADTEGTASEKIIVESAALPSPREVDLIAKVDRDG